MYMFDAIHLGSGRGYARLRQARIPSEYYEWVVEKHIHASYERKEANQQRQRQRQKTKTTKTNKNVRKGGRAESRHLELRSYERQLLLWRFSLWLISRVLLLPFLPFWDKKQKSRSNWHPFFFVIRRKRHREVKQLEKSMMMMKGESSLEELVGQHMFLFYVV